MNRVILVVLTGILAISSSAQQKAVPEPKQDTEPAESCPLHSEHMKQPKADKRFLDMNQRGTKAMGFDQTKTTHHFRSFDNGGAIEVTVKNPADTTDLEAIRNHLSKIAREFTNGDFSVPAMTHAEMPAGASAMRTLRDRIKYQYEEVPNGARVRITTADPEALHAIHQFLSYQVGEHRTGDYQCDLSLRRQRRRSSDMPQLRRQAHTDSSSWRCETSEGVSLLENRLSEIPRGRHLLPLLLQFKQTNPHRFA